MGGRVKTYGGNAANFVAIPSGYKKGKFLIFLERDSDDRLSSGGPGSLFPIKEKEFHWGDKVMDLKLLESQISTVVEDFETGAIRGFDGIAVVDVQKVAPAEHPLLGDRATGEVLRSVRGNLKGPIELDGGITRDLVGGVPSVFERGKLLVFLNRTKEEQLTGGKESAWISSNPEFVKPVRDGKVSWFGVDRPLDEVIEKIESMKK